MFNLQGSEIIFILLLALVVLGPEKLPSAIRRFTQIYGEIRKMGTGFQTELKSALDEPMREMRETAGLLKDSADPKKMMDQAEQESAAALRAEQDAERQMRAKELIEERKAKVAARAAGDEGTSDDASADDDTPADTSDVSTADASDVAGDDPPVADAMVDPEPEFDEWDDPVDDDADDRADLRAVASGDDDEKEEVA